MFKCIAPKQRRKDKIPIASPVNDLDNHHLKSLGMIGCYIHFKKGSKRITYWQRLSSCRLSKRTRLLRSSNPIQLRSLYLCRLQPESQLEISWRLLNRPNPLVFKPCRFSEDQRCVFLVVGFSTTIYGDSRFYPQPKYPGLALIASWQSS